jgi:hypothetical protein
MTPKIVVTGFEPWQHGSENPTLNVLDQLEQSNAVPGELITIRLPVDTTKLAAIVEEALDRVGPDVWISLGLATGHSVIAVERMAANVRDFPRPCENPANFCKQSRRAKFFAIFSLPSGLRARKSEQNRSVSKRVGVFTQAPTTAAISQAAIPFSLTGRRLICRPCRSKPLPSPSARPAFPQSSRTRRRPIYAIK